MILLKTKFFIFLLLFIFIIVDCKNNILDEDEKNVKVDIKKQTKQNNDLFIKIDNKNSITRKPVNSDSSQNTNHKARIYNNRKIASILVLIPKLKLLKEKIENSYLESTDIVELKTIPKIVISKDDLIDTINEFITKEEKYFNEKNYEYFYDNYYSKFVELLAKKRKYCF